VAGGRRSGANSLGGIVYRVVDLDRVAKTVFVVAQGPAFAVFSLEVRSRFRMPIHEVPLRWRRWDAIPLENAIQTIATGHNDVPLAAPLLFPHFCLDLLLTGAW